VGHADSEGGAPAAGTHSGSERQRGTDGFFAKKSAWPLERRFVRQESVDWISPPELLKAAHRSLLSKTFGDYADRRELIGLSAPLIDPDQPPDGIGSDGFFRRESDAEDLAKRSGKGHASSLAEYWIDFVADVGDGFDATYAVAEQLASDVLIPGLIKLPGHYDAGCFTDAPPLPRGRVLVMGGDEVYPVPINDPDKNSYLARTAGPYEAALQYRWGELGESKPVLHLYAIPGNHDWYDGLVAFTKQFCTGQWIGAWKTQQHRSYFAVQLPTKFKWWIWGIDIGFEGPIDRPQLEYFKRAGKALGPDEGVILCTAKPSWIDCPTRDDHGENSDAGEPHDNDKAYTLLRWFMEQAIPKEKLGVRLMLSGDSHFYARYDDATPQDVMSKRLVKIVSGGGGASLSMTHDLPAEIATREPHDTASTTYALNGQSWPSASTSRWRVPFGFIRRVFPLSLATKDRPAWSFSLFMSLLYLVFAYVMRLAASEASRPSLRVRRGLTAGNDIPIPRTGIGDVIRYIGGGGFSEWDRGFHRLWTETSHFARFWFLAIAALIGLLVLARKKGEGLFSWYLLWGLAHMVAHVVAILAVTTTAMVTAAYISADTGYLGIHPRPIVFVVCVVLAGFAVGPAVFVAYLFWASARNRSLSELGAVLSNPDWKNFLRIRVTERGLAVYVLGLQHVPRKRKLSWPNERADVAPTEVEWRLIDHFEIPRTPPHQV
jgi:hypothetical protein